MGRGMVVVCNHKYCCTGRCGIGTGYTHSHFNGFRAEVQIDRGWSHLGPWSRNHYCHKMPYKFVPAFRSLKYFALVGLGAKVVVASPPGVER